MEKYSNIGWMLADTYNTLINGFGNKFEEFSIREMINFCSSLSKAGLRQEDILSSTIDKIYEKATSLDF